MGGLHCGRCGTHVDTSDLKDVAGVMTCSKCRREAGTRDKICDRCGDAVDSVDSTETGHALCKKCTDSYFDWLTCKPGARIDTVYLAVEQEVEDRHIHGVFEREEDADACNRTLIEAERIRAGKWGKDEHWKPHNDYVVEEYGVTRA